MLWATFRKTLPTSEEKHGSESLTHGVTTHNWFVHYLWDIYGGFGRNGKIILNAPFPPILSHHAPNWLPDFEKLYPLRKRNMCVKVSHMVLPPITDLRITFGTYMEALGTMGR